MAIRTLPKNSEGPQQALFHEDINAALSGLVAALGGAKVVGSRLYPDLNPEAAARRLLDAVNPDRAQQLAPSQLLTLLKWGREAGHHGAMNFLADEAGYGRPPPIDPEDARAELQRQFIDAVNRAEQLGKRLQR
jgi:hypothetical protein